MCITKRINYAFYYYINASDKKTKTIWDNGFCPGTIGTKIRDNAGTKRKKVKVEPCLKLRVKSSKGSVTEYKII